MNQATQVLSNLPVVFFVIMGIGIFARWCLRGGGIPSQERQMWDKFLLLIVALFLLVAYFGGGRKSQRAASSDGYEAVREEPRQTRGRSIAEGRSDCKRLENGQIHCP